MTRWPVNSVQILADKIREEKWFCKDSQKTGLTNSHLKGTVLPQNYGRDNEDLQIYSSIANFCARQVSAWFGFGVTQPFRLRPLVLPLIDSINRGASRKQGGLGRYKSRR